MASVRSRVLVLFVCIASVAVSACSSDQVGAVPSDENNGRPGSRDRGGSVPVVTTTVQQKSMPATVKVVGAVEAVSTVQIHAQVTGQLSEITFREGHDVQKGQPLFDIDPRPFDVALKQAEAVLAKDTAQANNAEATRARSEDLLNRGLVPRNDYEALAATSAAMKASVDADAAAVEAAKLNLQYTRITAPAAGRTGALQVHVGDLIRANDTTPMVVINQVAPIYVTASVPGNILADIQRNRAKSPLRLEATAGDSTAPPAIGTLTFVDNAVDSTTGSIKIKGEFANRDGTLWPGLFVNVVLRLSVDPHAIVMPSTAVQQSQRGSYVYVVGQDETVEMRSITVARTEGGESVVAGGLRAGERVVVDGQLRLTPGAHITEQPTSADAGATR